MFPVFLNGPVRTSQTLKLTVLSEIYEIFTGVLHSAMNTGLYKRLWPEFKFKKFKAT